MKTYDDLKRETEQRGGITTVTTEVLCHIDGNKYLTRECANRIGSSLSWHGLGYLPAPFPRDHGTVVVYAKGTPVGDLVGAVVDLTKGRNLGDAMDAVRAAVATPQNEAVAIVNQIRALVRDPAPQDETP